MKHTLKIYKIQQWNICVKASSYETPTEAEVTLCEFKATAVGEDTASVTLRPFYLIGNLRPFYLIVFQYLLYIMGRNSIVSIATLYGLDSLGIESQ